MRAVPPGAVKAEPGHKALCHSDLSNASGAQAVQNDLVQLRRSPAAE